MPICLALAAVWLTSCAVPSWGLDAITTMQTPADPALACESMIQPPADTTQADRAACRFGKGAMASETLGVAEGVLANLPIRHVVVLMRENRSFDHLFGMLQKEGLADVDGIPATFTNVDGHGRKVPFQHAHTTCLNVMPDHQWDAMHAGVDGGTMDGFARSAAASTDTSGDFALFSYQQSDLPFYSWLASTYAVDDRHFAAIRSGTDPNRDFLLFGTNAGIKETGATTPDPATPSILHALMDAGFTWGAYSDGFPFGNALGWTGSEPGVHSLHHFLRALDDGTLPNVAFVDGVDSVDDDCPPADLQAGEAWLHAIYDHAVQSPEWSRTALVWTYDEAGGFADHVPPPPGCAPSTDPADQPYFERGPRVPLVVVSPYAKRHYVSHVAEDHTAITRFIEALFGLPALTARDANSPALLDLFDFSCDAAQLPTPFPPAAGVKGCAD